MSTTGIIVEFNPFHNGHAAHISETKKRTGCKHIIAVMSGNFVQRGEPAIFDKWQRTKTALTQGVDIVIEIPMPYVIAGADYFARASVKLLEATGVVDTLSFGSESGNLDEIKAAAGVLAKEPQLYKETLRKGLDAGLSFAVAKGDALAACLGKVSDGLLIKPNNGLAIEYCKALKLLDSSMQVITTHRTPGGPSATKIRRELAEQGRVVTLDDFSDIFKYLLYTNEKVVTNLSEGLGNRLQRMCGEFSKISDLLQAAKTKRYTYTRLQRTVLGMVLGVSSRDMEEYDRHGGVQYIRVLGFRKEAAGLVGEITRRATLPVITTGADIDKILHGGGLAAKMLASELTAGDVYRVASNTSGGHHSERKVGVVVC